MSNKTHRTNPDSQILLPPGVQKPQVIQAFEFDGGFIFPHDPRALPFLELCYRARRGDVSATEVLKQFGYQLTDLKGYQYWPMVDEVKQPKEESLIGLIDDPKPAEPTSPACGES